MANIKLLLYAGLIVCVACAKGSVHPADARARIELQALMRLIRTGEIRKVEIFAIPGHVVTSTRITPEMLEATYWYRIEIPDIRTDGSRTAHLNAEVTSWAEPSDLRYGAVFYDAAGKRSGAVYFDKTGRHGFVNGTPVGITGTAFEWMKHAVSCLE
ncbi:MAG TPA: hypothetical protein VG323_01810 [Thermoanaerobaculia bacterium]|nr:hypothetical protein [Thermoanaerobaculia bacterium]